jgi:hypothetical protein
MTVEFLNLLTCKGGIALEGYTHRLKFLLENQMIFLEVIENWPVFCIEYVYMLDCIFQHFVTELGHYYQDSNPTREARAELKYQHARQFQTMMAGFKVSSIPNLCPPGTLTLSVAETQGGIGDSAVVAGSSWKQGTCPREGSKQLWLDVSQPMSGGAVGVPRQKELFQFL